MKTSLDSFVLEKNSVCVCVCVCIYVYVYISLYLLLLFIHYYSITVLQIFPLCPPLPSPPPAPIVNPYTVVHVHGLFIHCFD